RLALLGRQTGHQPLQGGLELLEGPGHAVEAVALAEVRQMRAGKEGGRNAEPAQQPLDQDACRALALGAGDVDEALPRLRRAHAGEPAAEAVEVVLPVVVAPGERRLFEVEEAVEDHESSLKGPAPRTGKF